MAKVAKAAFSPALAEMSLSTGQATLGIIETGTDVIIKKKKKKTWSFEGPSRTLDEYRQWAEEKSLDENHPLAKDILSIS
jgi:hypothetical protein